jgi:L-asparaginase II
VSELRHMQQPGKVVVTRGGIEESAHAVRFAAADPEGAIVASGGDIEQLTFLRSSAKPLICAVVVGSGAADHFGFTDAEIALGAGSHSGEPFHVAAARSMLAKAGLTEDDLRCGAHAPYNVQAALDLAAAGIEPGRIHNNCSGKHAGILALAVHLGAGAAGYLEVTHPAESAILDGCAEMLGVPLASFAVGVDGCGIPVIATPISVAARFFAKFAAPQRFATKWRDALVRVRDAMMAYPEMVAGTGEFDTDLMRSAPGDIIGKGGAEGYHASAALRRGLGLCVKIVDGNARAVPPFVVEQLAELDMLTAAQSGALSAYHRKLVKNRAGTVAGEIFAEPRSARSESNR